MTETGRRKLIQKNIYDIFHAKDEIDIKISIPNKWFSSDATYTKDIISLCLICRLLKPSIIFEIGTLDGYTAYHFALNTSKETEIYTLDLPKDKRICPELNITYIDKLHILAAQQTREYVFSGRPEGAKIHCLYGDSHKFDFSPFHNKVDFFFIDGAHSYEYVRCDSETAGMCGRKGGVIAWHDYGRTGVNGVSRYLDKLARRHQIYCVPGSSIAFMVVS